MASVYATRRTTSTRVRFLMVGLASLLGVGALLLVSNYLAYNSPAQTAQRAVMYDALIPKGPVPFPKSPADQYSMAERRAVINSVSTAGKNAEVAAGSGYEGQALHSWNQFFATHNGMKHTE